MSYKRLRTPSQLFELLVQVTSSSAVAPLVVPSQEPRPTSAAVNAPPTNVNFPVASDSLSEALNTRPQSTIQQSSVVAEDVMVDLTPKNRVLLSTSTVVCATCSAVYNPPLLAHFTSAQLRKKPGTMRCKTCVASIPPHLPRAAKNAGQHQQHKQQQMETLTEQAQRTIAQDILGNASVDCVIDSKLKAEAHTVSTEGGKAFTSASTTSAPAIITAATPAITASSPPAASRGDRRRFSRLSRLTQLLRACAVDSSLASIAKAGCSEAVRSKIDELVAHSGASDWSGDSRESGKYGDRLVSTVVEDGTFSPLSTWITPSASSSSSATTASTQTTTSMRGGVRELDVDVVASEETVHVAASLTLRAVETMLEKELCGKQDPQRHHRAGGEVGEDEAEREKKSSLRDEGDTHCIQPLNVDWARLSPWVDPVETGFLWPDKGMRKRRQQENVAKAVDVVVTMMKKNRERRMCEKTKTAKREEEEEKEAGIEERELKHGLERPISIAEFGCSAGNSGLALSELFPNCSLLMFDIDARAVQVALMRVWMARRFPRSMSVTSALETLTRARIRDAAMTRTPLVDPLGSQMCPLGTEEAKTSTSSTSTSMPPPLASLRHFPWHIDSTSVEGLPDNCACTNTSVVASSTPIQFLPLSSSSPSSSSSSLSSPPIDVVVAVHACGVVSDYALVHAFHRRAAFVLLPCCSGKISTQNKSGDVDIPVPVAATGATGDGCCEGKNPVNPAAENAQSQATHAQAALNSVLLDAMDPFDVEKLSLEASPLAVTSQVSYPRSESVRRLFRAAVRSNAARKAEEDRRIGQLQAKRHRAGDSTGGITRVHDNDDIEEHERSLLSRNEIDNTDNSLSNTSASSGANEASEVYSLYLELAAAAESVSAPPIPANDKESEALNVGLEACYRLSKALLEYDRCEWARENGYAVVHAKLFPLSSSGKNDILVGIPMTLVGD